MPRKSAPPPPIARPRKRRGDYPNRIHELSRQQNLTYADVADKVGAHEITIAKLAKGKQNRAGIGSEIRVKSGESVPAPFTPDAPGNKTEHSAHNRNSDKKAPPARRRRGPGGRHQAA